MYKNNLPSSTLLPGKMKAHANVDLLVLIAVLAIGGVCAASQGEPPRQALFAHEPEVVKHATISGPTGIDIVFSSDDSRVLIAGADSARIWNVGRVKAVTAPLSENAPLVAAAMSCDAERVLTVSSRRASLWNGQTAARIVTLGTEVKWLCGQFSPDGRKWAVGDTMGRVLVYDAHTGRELRLLKHPHGVKYVCFSPDGALLLADELCAPVEHGGESGMVRLWNLNDGNELMRHSVEDEPHGADQRFVRPVAVDWARKRVATIRFRDVEVWDYVSGRILKRWDAWGQGAAVGPTVSVCFSPDGSRLLTIGAFAAQMWDVASGALIDPEFTNPDMPFVGARVAMFDASGRYVLTAADDRGTGVWETSGGRRILNVTGPTYDAIPAVAFGNEARYVAVGYAEDGITTIWHIRANRSREASGDSKR